MFSCSNFILVHVQCNKQLSLHITPNNDLDDGGNLASSHIYMRESSSRFDEKNHILRRMKCNSMPHEQLITKCSLNWNKVSGYISRLWLPKLYDNGKFRRDPSDCQYDWIYDGWDHSSNFIIYSFTIHQHSCRTNVTLLGGSTFDIFAYGPLSTVGCTYTDTRNNNYQVQCQLPCLSHKCNEELRRLHTEKQHNDNDNGNDCIHVTAILSHEHYDSFAEISLTTEEPLLRAVLQDNQTYCRSTTYTSKETSTSRKVNSGGRHNHKHHEQQSRGGIYTSPLPSWGSRLPPDVRVYTGIWVTSHMLNIHKQIQQQQQQQVQATSLLSSSSSSSRNNNRSNLLELIIDPSISLYSLKRMEKLTAYDIYTEENQIYTINYTTNIPPPKITRTPPLIAMIPPSVLSDRYTFLPIVHFKHKININDSHNNNNNINILSHVLNGLNSSLSNNTSIKKRKFIFMGASHLRYNFDGVIDFIFGSDVIRNIPRKHVNLIIEKTFSFEWTVFTSEISLSLRKFCELNTSSSSDGSGSSSSGGSSGSVGSQAAVVFIQTGHWDLWLNSLRYVTRNHTGSPGYKLLQLFNDIFTGTLPCPSISHIVWMTTVPHPLCFSHSDNTYCDSSRGHRLNANINAINEFFLKSILSSYANATSTPTSTSTNETITNNIRLSVIDAYSILHPRIIYDENNELIFLNHFSCRYDGQRPVYTPGGAAVLQSMLSVIGDV
eukprot:gene4844-9648_t